MKNKEDIHSRMIVYTFVFIFIMIMLLFDYDKYHNQISGGYMYVSMLYMLTASLKKRMSFDIFFIILVSLFLLILYLYFDYDIFKGIKNYRLLIYIRLLIFVFNYISQKFYQRNVSIGSWDNVKTEGRRFFDFSYLITCIVVTVLVTKQII